MSAETTPTLPTELHPGNSLTTIKQWLKGNQTLVIVLIGALAFALYAAQITRNPPGFYLDESSIAYNAYTIAQSGRDEHGVMLPLYFEAFGEYKNPIYIYLLAIVFKIFGPGVLAARLLSVTLGFLAAMLFGWLALRLSDNRRVAILVTVSVLLTPWFFEISRLVFEVALFPLVLTLFLLMLHRAGSRKRWSWPDSLALAATLALITYTYSTGRLLSVLLAAGFVFFVTRENLIAVARTWFLFALACIPLWVFNLHHPGALTSRFQHLTYVRPKFSLLAILKMFFEHYAENMNPWEFLLHGDPNRRHHVTDTGSILVVILLLAGFGAWLILRHQFHHAWWRFILYGFVISAVPASLTRQDYHALRLISVPVFLLTLTIPAWQWFVAASREHPVRQRVLLILIGLMLAQAAFFQIQFRKLGPKRINEFEATYKEVFDAAAATPVRPIYLSNEPADAYIHAYWYGTLRGLDASQFVNLAEGESPPGVLVIGEKPKNPGDQLIYGREPFYAYFTAP